MTYPFDPQVAAAVEYAPTLDLSDLAGARAATAAVSASLPPFAPRQSIEHQALSAGSAADAPPTPVHVLTPRETDASGTGRPALVWFHGGGFVLGSAQDSLTFLEQITEKLGVVSLSVEYALAPESPYPGPIDEGIAVIAWLREHSEKFGVNPAQIAIGGQSAGGAYAAGITLRMRDEGLELPFFQLLDVPVIDDSVSTESATTYVDTPMWNKSNAEHSWDLYAGEDRSGLPPYASPARETDVSGLPPTFVSVSQFDPLRDEGIEYARRLAQAGVATELHLYPGTFHGSSGIAVGADVSNRQLSDLVEALERALSVLPPSGAPE